MQAKANDQDRISPAHGRGRTGHPIEMAMMSFANLWGGWWFWVVSGLKPLPFREGLGLCIISSFFPWGHAPTPRSPPLKGRGG